MATSTGVTTTTATPAPTPSRSGSLDYPGYAYPYEPHGRPLASTKKDGLTLSYYEAGRTTARTNSTSVFADTGQPAWNAGQPIVYIDAILTNASNRDIFVGVSILPPPKATVDVKPFKQYIVSLSNLFAPDLSTAQSLGIEPYGINTTHYDFTQGDHFLLRSGQSLAQPFVLPLLRGVAFELTPSIRTYDGGPKASPFHDITFNKVSIVLA